ncbi:neuronal pentraxin-1-like [Oculina patagonica]
MMFSLLICFCFGTIFCGYANGYSPNDYALYFREKGVTDYSNIWGMPSLTEFTVCFWMKSTDPGAPFSYAAAAHANELMLYCHPTHFAFLIHGSKKEISVTVPDGNWHHICASWKNTGAWKFYKDGAVAQSGVGFKTGYTVQGGGSLMLGQEQDSVGGSLVASESLKGMLTNVNVWNRELTSCEIEALSTNSCLAGEGNVYKWADFIYGVKGNTAIVISSPCSP